MSMSDWAERECRIACGKINPKFDFDGDGFDYDCSCYKSALKAYKSLMDDGHSGMSFSFTKNILERLMDGQPLTPITDEDFFFENGDGVCEPPEYLVKRGIKSSIQCPRMPSLFREETLYGKVTYRDVERCVMVNVEEPSDTFSSSDDRIIDELFPITMPYMPKKGRYEIYTQTFLTDRKNGDFDTRALLYTITPDGKRVDLNIYETERDGQWARITKDEYDALLEKRIDKLSRKIAEHLLWTLVSNSASEEETARRESAYKEKTDDEVDLYLETLTEMCGFFNDPENYKYNTFGVIQKLCRGEVFEKPELAKIGEFLKYILGDLNI